MVTVNVCLAGLLVTAPNVSAATDDMLLCLEEMQLLWIQRVSCVFQPVVQDVLALSALRPVPVRQTSDVTDLLETVCVTVEEVTACKVQMS